MAQNPRDRYGPVILEELLGGGRIAREIFRTKAWQPLTPEGKKRACTAANRVLLGSTDTGLSSVISKWSWESDCTALQSHLIDPASFHALREDDIETFLRRRAAAVADAVNRLISDRAAWEAVLRPLNAYYEYDLGSVPRD